MTCMTKRPPTPGRSASEGRTVLMEAGVRSSPLLTALRRSGRRLIVVHGLAGAARAAAVASLALCAGVWLDLVWDLAPRQRVGVVVVAPVLGLFLLGVALRLARREAAAPALARRVDAAAGANGRVRAGVDLLLAGDHPVP